MDRSYQVVNSASLALIIPPYSYLELAIARRYLWADVG